jgi:hypothetical protein
MARSDEHMGNPPLPAIRRLTTVDDLRIEQLSDVLIDCVEGGASVSFMHPLTRERALTQLPHFVV